MAAQASTFYKSPQVTQLDQSVFTSTNRLTSGMGGLGRVTQRRGVIALQSVTQASTTFSRMVRVPTNSTIVSVKTMYEVPSGGAITATTFAGNIGFWASDAPAPGDGTPAYWLGYTSLAISDSFFAYHYTMTTTLTDVTFQAWQGAAGVTDGMYAPSASIYELWDAVQNGGAGRVTVAGYNEQTQGLGYSSATTAPWTSPANSGTVLLTVGDPGGFVDIGFRPSAALNLSAVVNLILEVNFIFG